MSQKNMVAQLTERERVLFQPWRDRYNSVMELFMAGGHYAADGVAFPSGYAAAVEVEIAAARG